MSRNKNLSVAVSQNETIVSEEMNETIVQNETINESINESNDSIGESIETIDRTYESYIEEFKTKSALIRHLTSIGKKRGEIAKFMNIRYQHVRNVLITPLKKV